jgi:hypothetical protein
MPETTVQFVMRAPAYPTPLLVREPEKQFTETVHYRESKRILDIMDVLGVKRGPISRNRGSDSNPFFDRLGLAIAAPFQSFRW